MRMLTCGGGFLPLPEEENMLTKLLASVTLVVVFGLESPTTVK